MANHIIRVAFATSIFTVCWGMPSLRGRTARSAAIKSEEASPSEFPWQAQLLKWGTHVCGAVLVSDQWLLTAAHCLAGLEKLDAYEVVLGEHDVSVEEGTEQRRRLVRKVFFRGRGSHKSDIALVQLDRPAVLTDSVQPIALPRHSDDFTGLKGVAAGWGASDATAHGPVYPRRLHKVSLRILSDAACLRRLVFFNFARRTMLCAAPAAGSLCWGDSGGGLVHYRAPGRPVLAAITSWGVDCGLSSTPAVFVSVAHHARWVRDVIAESGPVAAA